MRTFIIKEFIEKRRVWWVFYRKATVTIWQSAVVGENFRALYEGTQRITPWCDEDGVIAERATGYSAASTDLDGHVRYASNHNEEAHKKALWEIDIVERTLENESNL